MNEYELSKNEHLEEYKVKDLNVDPKFPFEDNSFDVVTCVVSVSLLLWYVEVRYVWYGMIRRSVVWRGVSRYGTSLYGHGMVWYGMV